MTAEEMMGHIHDLAAAAEVVEAIDDPALQKRRGWDLGGWSYELVPWGVRFVYRERYGYETELLVLAVMKQGPSGLPAGGVRVVLSTSGRQEGPASLRA